MDNYHIPMEDRTKTLAAVAIIVGFLVMIAIIIGALMSRQNLVSPIPDEGSIRIIFVSPTSAVQKVPLQSPTSPAATGSGAKKS